MVALQERAMLVRLNLRHWTATKNDRSVVDEVAEKHQTNGRDIGCFNKRLIDPAALKPIKKLVDNARSDHYELSLPFDDAGWRLLPADIYEGYCVQMRRHRERFERCRDAFLGQYNDLARDAERELGSLYRRNEYPVRDQLAERFGFKTDFRPIPDSGHFVVEVAAEQKASIDRNTLEAAERAAADVWQRVHDRAQKLASGLRDYADDSGKVQRNFRKSLVENVTHLADLLPKLNFMGDPGLDRMASRLKDELCQFEADTLKADPTLRREIVTKAEAVETEVDQVLETMGGYL